MITSRANPAVKRIRALGSRRERENSGLCFVEGIRPVGEAVESGASVETLVVAPDLLTSTFGRDLVSRLRGDGVDVLEVSPEVFGSFSLKEGPQGLAAVVRQRWSSLDAIRPAGLGWVALEGVQDPGNLGTILRTADATGVEGVILLGHTADPYDPTAIRAGMGAVFTETLVRATLPELAAWKARGGAPIVGTSDAADADYAAVRYPVPLVLLMGSEQKGLSSEALDLCDLVVRIPMVGRMDSLNLAVATGVVLYRIFEGMRDI